METSFMYQALGIREQECSRVRYEGGKIILAIRTREDKLYCAKCGSRHVIKSGSTVRRFRCVPIGSRQIILEMTVQRLECKDCGAVQQERIHFVRGKERYTYRMKHFVLDLCKIGTISDIAKFLHMSWDTVKDILSWYDFQITNGKLEGINNKIKTMKRQAYGYRDMDFFKLKLLSLHDSTYPFSG